MTEDSSGVRHMCQWPTGNLATGEMVCGRTARYVVLGTPYRGYRGNPSADIDACMTHAKSGREHGFTVIRREDYAR